MFLQLQVRCGHCVQGSIEEQVFQLHIIKLSFSIHEEQIKAVSDNFMGTYKVKVDLFHHSFHSVAGSSHASNPSSSSLPSSELVHVTTISQL